jgi:hypothetical protein
MKPSIGELALLAARPADLPYSLILAVICAAAQSTEPLTSPYPAAAPQGVAAPTTQPGALSVGPTGPQINVAKITRRANQDVGVDIDTTITGWQRELDRLDLTVHSQGGNWG